MINLISENPGRQRHPPDSGHQRGRHDRVDQWTPPHWLSTLRGRQDAEGAAQRERVHHQAGGAPESFR